ncbi:protein-cysteine N-palmitoyltransferase HHAT-like [Glandiceps talaboti]
MKSPEMENQAGKQGYISWLTTIELCFCGVTWFGSSGYAFYRVYTASRDKWFSLHDYDLDEGISVLGGKKDISDFEWTFWINVLFQLPSICLFVGHILLGRLLAIYFTKYRQFVLLVYSLTTLYLLLGSKTLGILVGNAIIMYMVALFKIPVLCWIFGTMQVVALNHNPMKEWQQQLYEERDDQYYLMVFTLAMANLRFLSFALEYCKLPSPGEKTNGIGLVDYLVYAFYLPLFFCGPVLTFDKFYNQINQPTRQLSLSKLLHLIKEIVRLLLWVVFIEVWFHFMYFAALQRNFALFKYLPNWVIAGIGYCQVQFFQVKYVVMFGLPRTIALFDHITAPHQPACVSALYTFQDMWRYFDRGLHSWLVKYIYIPCGGSKHGLFVQLLSSLMCFAYVAYWHGGENYLFVWCLLNWVGVSIETLLKKFSQTAFMQRVQAKIPDFLLCQLKLLLMTPMFGMLAVSNLVFLGGIRVGYVYFDRFYISGWPNTTLFLLLTLYCNARIVHFLQQRWKYFER